MNKHSPESILKSSLRATLVAALLAPVAAQAQVPVDEHGAPLAPIGAEVESIGESSTDADLLSSTELEDLVGPVALYPDDLLAIVLPASTYPLEIVQAARFLEELALDASLQPNDEWDESVTALLNYPEVIQMMDEEIDWTWRLGEAVISQQNELIAAVESFRDRAYAAGNLKTDEYQTVSNDEGAIEIEPADEEIIYVPYYEPAEVVVYQPRPVYYYHPHAYPVYYYPYPSGYNFSSRYFWGVTTAFTIGWNSHYLHVHHPSYWGHPYYGRSYYGHYYRRPSINIYNNWYVNNRSYNARYRYRDGDYWRPRVRSGARPHEQRVRNLHYPSINRGNSNRGQVGASPRVRNNGRMDLELRERQVNRRDRSRNSSSRNGTEVVTNRESRRSGQTVPQRDDSNRRAVNRRGENRDQTTNVNRNRALQNRARTTATSNRSAARNNGTNTSGTVRRSEREPITTRRQNEQRGRTVTNGVGRSSQNTVSRSATTRRAAPERVSSPRQRQSTAARARVNNSSNARMANRSVNRSAAPRAAARQQTTRTTSRVKTSATANRNTSSARSGDRRNPRKPR